MQTLKPDEIELGLLVNLEIFREILKKVSTGRTRFWIASDPADALETGSITIGQGWPGAEDRLNSAYFRIPILNDVMPRRGAARLVLLIAPSVIYPDSTGFRADDGLITATDILDDFREFLSPIKSAVVDLLKSAD